LIIYLAGIISDKSQKDGEERLFKKAQKWHRLLSYHYVNLNPNPFNVILAIKENNEQ